MRETFSRGLAVSIGLVVALLLLDAGLTYRNTRQLDDDARWVAHTHEVLDALEEVVSGVKSAETQQRGFVITGDPRYLKPYDNAVGGVNKKVEHVAELTADNRIQQERLPDLRTLVAARLAELDRVIAVREAQGFDAARQGILADQDRADANTLPTLVREMEGEERKLLRDREQQSRRSYRVAVVTDLLTSLLGLVLVGLLLLVLVRHLNARRQAAAVLHDQRELFRTTLASIGDAVITTDTGGHVTFLNAVAQALTGWRPDAALGRPLVSVFRIINEQTRQPAEDPVSRALRVGVIVGLANHTVLVAQDGTERPIDDSAAPIRNEAGHVAGVVLVFRDVTERRRLERLQRDLQGQLERQVEERTAELRASEERFRLLVEGTTDYAIFMLDLQGNIASWNPGAERIKGYRADEIIGRHFRCFYPEEDARRGKPEKELEIAAAEGKYEEEGWRVRMDGSRFWASIVLTALRDEDGNLRGFSKITRDVTDRKQAEENARRLLQEQAAREAAEEAQRQLRASEARLRLFVEHAPAAVAMFDRDMRYLLVSRRWLSDYGLGAADLGGRSHYDVFPDLPERWKEIHRRCLAGAVEKSDEDRFPRADGTEDWLRWEVRPWRDDRGEIGGILIFSEVITQRVEAEAALRQSEEQFRRAIVDAPIPIIMHAEDGEILQVSNAWVRLGGYTPEAVRTFDSWLVRAFGPRADEVRADVGRLFHLEQGGADRELTVLTRDGEKRVWHFTASAPGLLRDGRRFLVAMAPDVTDRKRAEWSARFLADASTTLAALVDERSTLQKVAGLAVPFFADWCAVDMQCDGGALERVAVAHVEPAKVELAHELYRRYPPNPDAPDGVGNILRTGRSEIVPEITDGMLEERVRDPELLRILRELGLKSYIGVPLRARGKTLGVVTFIAAESGRRYDATDLAVAEDLADRAGIAVENARLYAELREADRLKDEFLAMLAHELRNPLAPIRNALHIMGMPAAGAIVEQVREMAERQVRHMARLLDDLLDVSRISRGRIELRREPVDLASVANRTVETQHALAEDRRHELTVSLPPEPVWVDADATRLEQVMSNLVNNSVKYTEPGGHIRLIVEREGNEAVVRVRDDGIGIAPDMLPRIFDLFVQAERRLDRSQGGIGIGLTLVKRLVELHGGTVEAHSAGLGQGSEFVVRLPALPGGRAGEAAVREGRGGSAPVPAPRRVLVVDDNDDAANSLAMLLRLEGQEVRVAFNGPSAIELAREFRPQMVFLDIGMPGMDGYEVARRLRDLPDLGGAVLVAQTGWGQEEDRRRSQGAGFDKHLVKPTDPAALRSLLVSLDLGKG